MRISGFLVVSCLALAGVIPSVWAKETNDVTTSVSPKTSTAWDYKSDQYGFSMTLPDSGWIKSSSSIHGAVGFLKKGFAMRTDIFVIPCETEPAFQKMAERIKHEMDSARGISDNAHEEGKTASGRRYQYSHATEKNANAKSGIYLGQSLVWVEDKKIAVRICFQGESQSHGASAQGVDPKVLVTSARAICLSVK